MGFISCVHKRTKWKYLAYDLMITFVGNYLGCILCALFIALLPIFTTDGSKFQANDVTAQFMTFAMGKITMSWWQNLLAAILCNILVLGSVMAWVMLENKAASVLIIIVFITVFVLSGYQHIVADMFISTLAGFITILSTGLEALIGSSLMLTGSNVGKLFYDCIIPATIGNFIGGIFLISIYYMINVHVYKHVKFDPIHQEYVNEKTLDSYSNKMNEKEILNHKIDALQQKYIADYQKIKQQLKTNKQNLSKLLTDLSLSQAKIKAINSKIENNKKAIKKLKTKYQYEYAKLVGGKKN